MYYKPNSSLIVSDECPNIIRTAPLLKISKVKAQSASVLICARVSIDCTQSLEFTMLWRWSFAMFFAKVSMKFSVLNASLGTNSESSSFPSLISSSANFARLSHCERECLISFARVRSSSSVLTDLDKKAFPSPAVFSVKVLILFSTSSSGRSNVTVLAPSVTIVFIAITMLIDKIFVVYPQCKDKYNN